MLEILKQVDSNQNKIESLGKLSEDVLKKINYRIRLDWNYYSNKMEGGTLTRSETRDVMIGIGVIKPIKDVTEMNGHDKVVLDLLKIGKGDLRISEKRIKEIHSAIMYEDNDELKKEIGQWKSEPNEIINYKNEKVRFSEPADVAEEMHKLMDWLNAEIDKFTHVKTKSPHPVNLAAEFHLRYVSTHPFYDGNGRTARILTNLILLSLGYPPIIIKDEHRKEYYSLLGDIQSYGGNTELFYQFLANRVLETQEIYLKASVGESIDEDDDLDKRLKLLDQQFEVISDREEVKLMLSKLTLQGIMSSWLGEFYKEFVPLIHKFNKYYFVNRHILFFNKSGNDIDLEIHEKDAFSEVRHRLSRMPDDELFTKIDFKLQVHYNNFKKGGVNSFGCHYSIEINFHETYYQIVYEVFDNTTKERKEITLTKRLLSDYLTSVEIKNILMDFGKSLADHIEFYMKPENRKNADDE